MQMCPICQMVYDESEYAKCPYCSGEEFADADDELYDPSNDLEEYVDPGYDYLYTDDGDTISCPNCGSDLRYNNGCCCIECDSTFTDQEIDDYAGPWHHS